MALTSLLLFLQCLAGTVAASSFRHLLDVDQSAKMLSVDFTPSVLKAQSSTAQPNAVPLDADSEEEEEADPEEAGELEEEGDSVEDGVLDAPETDIVASMNGKHESFLQKELMTSASTSKKDKKLKSSSQVGVSGAVVDSSLAKLNQRKEELRQTQKEFEQSKASLQQASQALKVQRLETENIMNINQDRASEMLLNAKYDVKQKIE